MQYFLDHPTTIGGPVVEVEIDESKFGLTHVGSTTVVKEWTDTGCLEGWKG